MVKYKHASGMLLIGSMVLGPFWVPYYKEYLMPPISDGCYDMVVRLVPFVGLVAFGCFMALIGANMAFWGRSWRRTLFFASFSVFTLGPFFLGTFLGALSIIYLWNARGEFDEDQSLYGPDILRTPTTRPPPTGPG